MQDTIRDLKENAFGIGKGNDSSIRYHQEHLDTSNSIQKQLSSQPANISGQDNGAELRLGKNQTGYAGADVRFIEGRNKKKVPAIKPNARNSALKNAPIKDTALLQNIQNKVIVK